MPGANVLCLNNARFAVSVEWRDFQGNTGSGKAVPLTADTGYFWFFTDTNVELVVKVLDATALNGHFWVFYGALSNVEYTMTVTDTTTSVQKVYSNPSGRFGSAGDTQAFASSVGSTPAAASDLTGGPSALGPSSAQIAPAASTKAKAAACVADATGLCLSGGRFRVEVNWKDFQGNTGRGQAIGLTADTGYFWFFNSANVELVVKVLDARGVNGNFWAFYGALSNVEYEIVVIDTETGESRRYQNPSGTFASAGDTGAFPLGPGTPYPALTDVGTPDGESATATIGPEGGSLTSPDGKLTLTLPPGAVSSAIEFGVQPVTNQAPGGIGKAYRLEPEGQTFGKAAELRFRYDEEDIGGTVPEALWVAYQDHQHFWRGVTPISLDKTSQTVTASAMHLSIWSGLSGFQLRPGRATVPPTKALGLRLFDCQQITISGLVRLAARCLPETDSDVGRLSGWAVNGIAGGNGTVGTVVSTGDFGATYTAPAAVPAPNLVAVSAHLDGSLGGGITVVSNVKISDEWFDEWKGTAVWQTCGDHSFSATSNVTWLLDGPPLNGLYNYRPSQVESTVAVSGCTITPSVVTTGNTNAGVLSIDPSTDPPTYFGSGTYIYPAALACPLSKLVGIDAPVVYFGPVDPSKNKRLSADQQTISGSFSDGCSTVSWNFTRQGLAPLRTSP